MLLNIPHSPPVLESGSTACIVQLRVISAESLTEMMNYFLAWYYEGYAVLGPIWRASIACKKKGHHLVPVHRISC